MVRGHGYFKRLGPGLVTGAADDDPSGIGTYSQVGAAYGFALLWFMPLVGIMAAAVQEMAARLGLVTGQGLSSLIKTRFSRWVLLACVLVAVANTFNIAADLAAMGASARLVIPLPSGVLAVAMAGATLALEIFLPYHSYSRVLRYLALSLVAYVAVLFLVQIDWSAVLDGLTAPPLIFVMLLLARSRRTLGDRRSGMVSTTLVGLTLAASIAVPIAYVLS